MLRIITILLFLFTVSLSATEKHPIYNHIVNIKPSINKDYAMRLSNIIYKACKQYSLPCRIFTAILAQESMFELTAKNMSCGVKLDTYERVCVAADVGIAQINYKTIDRYNLDYEKLLTDLKYSVDAGAKVLSWFHKRYSKGDPAWYSRYNCGTRSTTKRATCQEYVELVERFL